MSNAERTRIVNGLMRDALLAARRDVPEVLIGKHFLIVDHDRKRLESVKQQLLLIGGDDMLISTALSPAVAHEIVVEHEGLIDVLLVSHDLGAGRDNGIELLMRMRRSGLSGHALALLYAGKLPRGARAKAKAAGFENVADPDDVTTRLLPALARRLVEGAPDDECD